MPKRPDINSVLVIGSGPIVIGQAAEFDYSGTQACRVLREEGVRVILVNSNPATIMTDPDFADATYVEPITAEVIESIIVKEKPDAILPTLGGQTALNAAIELHELGILAKHNVELIGAKVEAIKKGEDRQLFKDLVLEAGADVAKSYIAHTVAEAKEFAKDLGYPLVVRPSFTMGGLGSGFAYDEDELVRIVTDGLHYSPSTEVLLEESILGWKEYELELMRDQHDNTVVICSIENVDPVGVHTGDSITVAPALTLTDREYQNLRDIGIEIIRAVGVDTGGCNIQFAVDPTNGRVIVIEMNPRVSRSSALASKATGFPIAKIAAKLAIGYRLDEIPNDITRVTPASFEPTLDYVVVKVPRFAFEKFPAADDTLTTTMKSVGEAMAIGRNYTTALQKALRSLEKRGSSFHWGPEDRSVEELLVLAKRPTDGRIILVQQALRKGASLEQVFESTKIDPWFIDQIMLINEIADEIRSASELDAITLANAKNHGFSDAQIAQLRGTTEAEVRAHRHALAIRPVFKTVDTCAGEFPALTPYHYSSYDSETEVTPSNRKKIVILGSGPNRIGQGIEFDYCSVHSAWALKNAGINSIIINNNPETVSTDFDTADSLYFEPLTPEDVLSIIDKEQPDGLIVQFGGQTAINLATPLSQAGATILGTSVADIDRAENREKFDGVLEGLDIPRPHGASVTHIAEALDAAGRIGYPLMVRPSYVLGGRAMEIVYNNDELTSYLTEAVEASPEHPVLIDRYMVGREVEVDAISDGERVLIPGIMEHVERAGVHSGDSIAVYPPQNLSADTIATITDYTTRLALELHVRGVINIQYVVTDDGVYVLEVNPRSSRTIPFLSKVTGVPMVNLATRAALGEKLADMGWPSGLLPARNHVAVKAPVFSFAKMGQVEISLGPEMKSTGEVMGIDSDYAHALYKAVIAAGLHVPSSGTVLLTVADRDKAEAGTLAGRFAQLGYTLAATAGTARYLGSLGLAVTEVHKVHQQGRTIADLIKAGEVHLVVNTLTRGKQPERDGFKIRRAAVEHAVPCLTSIDTAREILNVLEVMGRSQTVNVKALQDYAGQ